LKIAIALRLEMPPQVPSKL